MEWRELAEDMAWVDNLSAARGSKAIGALSGLLSLWSADSTIILSI